MYMYGSWYGSSKHNNLTSTRGTCKVYVFNTYINLELIESK